MPSKPIDELKKLIGESKKTVEGLKIEAGKVNEFRNSVGDEDAQHDFAPLTFTRTAFFPRYRPEELEEYRDKFGTTYGFDLTFDPQYTIHGEQEYQFNRVPEINDELTGHTEIANIYQKNDGKMTFVIFETEYYDESDDLVLVERATNIEIKGDDDGKQ